MRNNVQGRPRTVAFILVCAVFIMVLGMTPLHAGKCEDAFIRCIHDPFWQTIVGSVYCGNGYVFCRKYVK